MYILDHLERTKWKNGVIMHGVKDMALRFNFCGQAGRWAFHFHPSWILWTI